MSKAKKLEQAYSILVDLGLPRPQLNERTALCLLCLLDMKPDTEWKDAKSPLVGITPIMDWAKEHYGTNYAPNTRETFRRQSMHQFIQAGICLYNPDKPDRPVNSPQAVYQIEPALLELLRQFGTSQYKDALAAYGKIRQSLAERYAREREMAMVPVKVKDGMEIKLSAGEHSELIRSIIESFSPRFAPNGELVYVGDTGDKHGYFDEALLKALGVNLDNHGKFPDVVIYFREKNWLLLIESVTSHGPVDAKRHEELCALFKSSTAGLVFVSAFPDRKVFLKYLETIAWETEVWIASAPTHMIHFNGVRFLGPYGDTNGG
jgi:hypothetical protein